MNNGSVSIEQSPLVERAKKDVARDTSLADAARAAGNVADLHALCLRLLTERKQLAEAFDGMVMGWSLLRDDREPQPSGSDKDAIAAIERIAQESIAFAREVVQAMSGKKL